MSSYKKQKLRLLYLGPMCTMKPPISFRLRVVVQGSFLQVRTHILAIISWCICRLLSCTNVIGFRLFDFYEYGTKIMVCHKAYEVRLFAFPDRKKIMKCLLNILKAI